MKPDENRDDVIAIWLAWLVPSITWSMFIISAIFFGFGKGSNHPTWFVTTMSLGIPASLFLAFYFGLRASSVRDKRLARIIVRGYFFGISTVAAPILSALPGLLL